MVDLKDCREKIFEARTFRWCSKTGHYSIKVIKNHAKSHILSSQILGSIQPHSCQSFCYEVSVLGMLVMVQDKG